MKLAGRLGPSVGETPFLWQAGLQLRDVSGDLKTPGGWGGSCGREPLHPVLYEMEKMRQL